MDTPILPKLPASLITDFTWSQHTVLEAWMLPAAVMGLWQGRANELTLNRATCGQQRDPKNLAPQMSALSTSPTQG